MKKIIFSVLLLFVLSVTNECNAQQGYAYDYYPTGNVYDDLSNQQYIYYTKDCWISVAVLPTSFRIDRKNKVTLCSDVPEVWQYNADHIKQYQSSKDNHPKGKAVGYKGTKPSIAKGKVKKQTNSPARGTAKGNEKEP